MHVDLWDPGTSLSKNSSGHHIINDMCDLTQFVVSTNTPETHSEHLTELFMENVVLSFGMVVIIVIDANSRFKVVFKDMCAALIIIYWPLAFGNHKGMSVEKYHRFLNKT